MQNRISLTKVTENIIITAPKNETPVTRRKCRRPKAYIITTPKRPMPIFCMRVLSLADSEQKITSGIKPITKPPAGSVMWWKPPQKPEKTGAPTMPKSIYVKTENNEYLVSKV